MKYKKYYIGIAILMIALLSIICLDFHSPKSKLFRSMLKRGVDIFFESEGDWNYSPWYFQLRSKLGLFSTLNTTSIIFSDLDLSEFDFNELRIIHEEYHVCLRRTNITDSQLKTICQFKNIIALDFAGCKYITDEGIREIANLESLQWLDISDTNCADYDVVLLKDIPNLKQLYLNHTHVSGSCFGTNDGWKSLKVLTLHGCKLNDDIFDTLSNTNLYSLNISLNENNEIPPNIENLLKKESFGRLYIVDKDLQEEDLLEKIPSEYRNKVDVGTCNCHDM